MAEAKRLFEDGATAYGSGNYEDAIKLWEKSYEISQKPLLFDNIANAYEKLGDFRKTRENLGKWREAAPPDERPMLDKRLANLDARIAREDEAARKAAEARAALDAARRQQDEEARTGKPWLTGAIVGGVGVGAVVAGIAVDGVANGQRPPASACRTVSGQNLCESSAKSAITSSNRLAIAGDVTWILGSAAVAAGVVLVLVRRPAAATEGPASTPPPPAAWLAPSVGGVVVGGTF